MKQAVFRLDAGKRNGLGHLMRCRALADALYEQGVECTFACKVIDPAINLTPHRLITIQSEDEFFSQSRNYQWIVVDHYEYSSEELYILFKHPDSKLVVLDDTGTRGHLYADVIINPLSKSRAFTSYQLSPEAQLLLGSQYALLGHAFQNMKTVDFAQRQKLVITFGGSDVAALTLPVLQAIQTSRHFNDHDIEVITGVACGYVADIEQFCQQNHYQHQHNVTNMADIFSSAKLAISAAGSTIFELACCGVPSVFAVVADNQWLAAREHHAQGWCRSIDCRKEKNIPELIEQAEHLLKDKHLAKYSQQAQTLVDGQGAQRVVQVLLAL